MRPAIETILSTVQKPARYTGGEYGAIYKDKETLRLRMALCFPDTYEIGMANLGMRILYGVINQMEGVSCERVFAPWFDMDEAMRRAGEPLFALESGDPVRDFDVLGFSVGYELAYTNVLNLLDLAGLPLYSAERPDLTPLVIAGGTTAYNPEPMAPFIDVFSIGEGEEALPELLELLDKAKRQGLDKTAFLREVAKLEGFYVPSLYEPIYDADGVQSGMAVKEGAPMPVVKRIVQNLEDSFFPTEDMVPSTEISQDRIMLELFRGCIRGCRFCQAGYVYRPVRQRSPERLARQCAEAVAYTGYQEVTLSSLSSNDYPALIPLCDALLPLCEEQHVNLSLPSLRADAFSLDLVDRLQRGGRRSGLTFAPEAGSQRLRDAINKNLSEEDLLAACARAFAGGFQAVKLYFMLGLPTETDEDVLGIVRLAARVYEVWREHSTNRSRGVRITVSTSCFVPKAHSPFQWEAQNTREEYLRKVHLLRDHIKNRSIVYNWHDPETSYMEAVFSMGDRRLAPVLVEAFRRGAKFDAWSEGFSLDRYLAAFAAAGVDPATYANRTRAREQWLPWSHISDGVETAHLLREWDAAYDGVTSQNCRENCVACGANRLLQEGKCHVGSTSAL